ncbi:MAG: InlB B-repeat-containing protein, partial [Firmicutes bacterium]|nr:InlB B-repeat-containing protein [Bacillota bacterium]
MRKGQKISIIISIIFVYALLAVFSFVLLGCNRYKKFVVTFETYGYGVIESQTVLYGQTAVKPPDPMQNGCKFGGWHTDPLKTAAFDFETAIKSDIILYAKYIKTYIVSFETLCFCEGFCTHVIPPVVTAEFSIIPFPADPLREGCEFTGWFLDADCLTPCEEGQRVTEDIILYAGWERIFYTLSFELCGGGDNFSQIVRVGEATSEPPAPKWDGHTFLGWFWDEEGAYRFEFGHILDLDWTLYALWAPVKENSYRVTFRLIYPKILSEEYLPAGSVIECPDDPHADGYRFCGWYADALFTLPFGFGEELHADTDVYARFVALYFVVFFDNECVFCTLAVEDGALVLPPDDPAREGFVFGGWYADAGLTEKFNFDKPITRNSVAYARYLSLFVCEFFDGNEFLFRESVIEGGVIENPSGREKDGFVFDGWFLDAGLTERFNFDRSITQNIVIYAKYLSIFVCGFYDGEELLFSKTVVEGNILERPAANPEKENFEFGGWFSDAELAEEFIFGLPITAETRVCAKFIRLYRFSAFVSGIAIYDI